MASSAVRAHAQTGRGRGRGRGHGIPPSTRNSSSSSPPTFRNPSPILRNTASPSPPPRRNPFPAPQNLPLARNPPPAPQNPPPVPRNPPSVSRPLSQDTIDRGHQYSIAQRVQCLTLIILRFSGPNIKVKIGVNGFTQTRIKKRTYVRRFRPEQDLRILDHYV